MIDEKQVGEAILDGLHSRFGTAEEVVTVDGKVVCSTITAGNPHSTLQILRTCITSSGIVQTYRLTRLEKQLA